MSGRTNGIRHDSSLAKLRQFVVWMEKQEAFGGGQGGGVIIAVEHAVDARLNSKGTMQGIGLGMLRIRRWIFKERSKPVMDEETRLAFADVTAALGTINTMLDKTIVGMATQGQFDTLMARMNDGFERVLDTTQALRKNSDSTQETLVTLGQRVTRLEEDVRRLRGGV